MSRLDELLRELCPDGVEFRRIKDFAKVLRGKRLTKDQLSDENDYPVFHGGLEPLGYYHDTNRKANTTMVINVGASAGTVGFCDRDFWSSDGCFCISHSELVIPKFVYLALSCKEKYLMGKVRKAGIPTLDAKILEELAIPVPPLEVQSEIVRILDNFTELTARKKQYEYYRNELLSFDEDVPVLTLPDISTNCDRQRKPVTKGNREAGEYPYYGASGIVDYVANYLIDGEYLLVSEDGANLLARSTPIAFSISGKNWVNNHAHVLQFETYEMQKYVEIYLNSIDLSKYISGGAQPKLNQENLNKIPIPVPSFERVKQIVDILVRFDSLCTSMSNGLPAEIEARQKQYEYYRDKLLSFKELA